MENESLWEQVGDYLYHRYISPTLPYFYNLPNNLDASQILIVVLAVVIGVLLAATVFVFYKQVIGALPRTLADLSATDEEHAKTLGELGCKGSFFLKISLKNRDSGLRRYVHLVGESELTPEDFTRQGAKRLRANRVSDFQNARFYLDFEKKEIALRRFALRENTWKSVLWTWVGGIVVVILIAAFLPQIMTFVDFAAGFFPG